MPHTSSIFFKVVDSGSNDDDEDFWEKWGPEDSGSNDDDDSWETKVGLISLMSFESSTIFVLNFSGDDGSWEILVGLTYTTLFESSADFPFINLIHRTHIALPGVRLRCLLLWFLQVLFSLSFCE